MWVMQVRGLSAGSTMQVLPVVRGETSCRRGRNGGISRQSLAHRSACIWYIEKISTLHFFPEFSRLIDTYFWAQFLCVLPDGRRLGLFVGVNFHKKRQGEIFLYISVQTHGNRFYKLEGVSKFPLSKLREFLPKLKDFSPELKFTEILLRLKQLNRWKSLNFLEVSFLSSNKCLLQFVVWKQFSAQFENK